MYKKRFIYCILLASERLFVFNFSLFNLLFILLNTRHRASCYRTQCQERPPSRTTSLDPFSFTSCLPSQNSSHSRNAAKMPLAVLGILIATRPNAPTEHAQAAWWSHHDKLSPTATSLPAFSRHSKDYTVSFTLNETWKRLAKSKAKLRKLIVRKKDSTENISLAAAEVRLLWAERDNFKRLYEKWFQFSYLRRTFFSNTHFLLSADAAF